MSLNDRREIESLGRNFAKLSFRLKANEVSLTKRTALRCRRGLTWAEKTFESHR